MAPSLNVDLLPLGVLIATPDGAATHANHVWTTITGQGQDEWRGTGWLEILDIEGRDLHGGELLDAVRSGQTYEADWTIAKSPNGARVLHVTATPEVVDGELLKMIIGMADVTQQRSTMAWLAHEATHDQLTGLYNRNQFLAFLNHALDRQTRSPERLAAVLFMDVDGLKATNDIYGHDAGDRLLRAVSSRILAAVRPTDVVARYGGDEFIVLCDDLDDADEAMVIGQRISEAARAAGVGDHACSLSIGVAMAAPSMDPIDVVQAADHAMYVMKRAGHRRGFRHGLTVVPDRHDTATQSVSAGTWVVPPVDEMRRRLSVIARSASLLRKSRHHMKSEDIDDTVVAIENQAHVLVAMVSDVIDLDSAAADTDRRPPVTR